MSVIFLDLDSTLIDVNSSKLWIRQEYSGGHISLAQLLRASWMLLRYRFGASELESALEGAAGELRGWPERQQRRRIAKDRALVCRRQRHRGPHSIGRSKR